MSFLLDTCVLSEVVRPDPEARVLTWLDSERICFLSSLTIGELKKGIESLPAGAKKVRLQTWLQENVMHEFSHRILTVDLAVALAWGQLLGDLQRRGIKLPVVDSLLAATALAHRLTLVTRNTKDFEFAGVSRLNPWL